MPAARVLLPGLPDPAPLPEAVLFAFDERAFPFQQYVHLRLFPGRKPTMVLPHGPPGSPDEVLLFYGTVVRIGDAFHMWYIGNHGPMLNEVGYERTTFAVCYATSADGVTWERPELGLVEFNGNKRNNLVDLPGTMPWSTFALLHEPDAPDPARRFKAAYGTRGEGTTGFAVAFSPDGLRWNPSPRNPVGPVHDPAGVTKHHGLYYLSGQAPGIARLPIARRLFTFVSADFERWSPLGAIGLDRSPRSTGGVASGGDADPNQFEEVHLGAGLWNRGNVILGVYGQWHGHPTGDRRLIAIDLGLAISHDAIEYREPVPGFKLISAREQPGTLPGVAPALMQGQAMENVGERTLCWYSTWRSTEVSGVRVVWWERDRLGTLQPFRREARVISCPIQALGGGARVYGNVGGLGPHAQLVVSVLDEGFVPLPGYSGADAAVVSESGLRVTLAWKGGPALLPSMGRVRLALDFAGVRPEDVCLHALYAGG